MKKITGILALVLVAVYFAAALEVRLEAFLEFDEISAEKKRDYIRIYTGGLFDTKYCWVRIRLSRYTGKLKNVPARVDFEKKEYQIIDDSRYLQNRPGYELRHVCVSKEYGVVFFLYETIKSPVKEFFIEYNGLTGESREVSKEYVTEHALNDPPYKGFSPSGVSREMGYDLTLIAYEDEETYATECRSEDGTCKLGIMKSSVIKKANLRYLDSYALDFMIDAYKFREKVAYTFLDENGNPLLVYLDDTKLSWNPQLNRVMLTTDFATMDEAVSRMYNKRLYVYHIIYDGVVNDTRVRLRNEPNLESQTLGHVNTGDKVKILDFSYEKQKIGEDEAFWYQVELPDGQTGWVYGAYVDME